MEKLTHGIPQAAADFVLRIVSPSGHTTPYEKVYSQEQSLAARGDIAAALDAYDDAMRRNPDDPEPRFQAAELLFRGLNPSARRNCSWRAAGWRVRIGRGSSTPRSD